MNKPNVLVRALPMVALLSLLSACSSLPQMPSWSFPQWNAPKAASPEPTAAAQTEALAPVRERAELLMGATSDGLLITFNASTPDQLIHKVALTGLIDGEQIAAMDFEPKRPALYALTNIGRVMRIDTTTGQVSSAGANLKLAGAGHWTMDVSSSGRSLRVIHEEGTILRVKLDPATGQAAEAVRGPVLGYPADDLLASIKPRIVALAYTRATDAEPGLPLAVDAATSFLVQQGRSITATADDVVADEHQLHSIGPLGIDRFDDAAMDIDDLSSAAYLVTTRTGLPQTKLYELNISSGQARLIGVVAQSHRLLALTIVP